MDPQASEDVRVIDLRIRIDSLPGTREEPATTATAREKGWLVAGLAIVLVLILLLGRFLFVRQRGARKRFLRRLP